MEHKHYGAATAVSSSSGAGTSVVKRMMESGLFSASLAHRVSASFQYLCSGSDSLSYFTLKDLTERGKFVFAYLSIAASQDTSFAVMDIFRQLDRSGTGRVHLEDFVVGIVRHLLSLATSSKRIDDLAVEMIQQLAPTGVTASILSALQDGELEGSIPQKLQRCPLFCANLLALKYRIESNLRHAGGRGVTHSVLAQIICASLEEVVAEMLQHFHMSIARLGELLAEDALYGSLGPGSGQGVEHVVQERLKAVTAARQRLQPFPVVWNPLNRGGHGSSGTGGFSAGGEAMTPTMKRQSMLAGGLVGVSGGGGGSSLQELLLAVHEGDDDDHYRQGGSGDGDMTGAPLNRRRNTMAALRQSILGGGGDGSGGGGGSSSSARRRETMGTFMDYLADMGIPTDGESSESALGRLDDCQMFLLETAYKSLDSFFALLAQDAEAEAGMDSNTLTTAASLRMGEANAAAGLGSEADAHRDIKQRLRGLKMLVWGDSAAGDDDVSSAPAGGAYGPSYRDRPHTLALAESILPAIDVSDRRGLGGRRDVRGSATGANSNSGGDGSSSRANQPASVEAELSKALCETQDELRRAKMRLEILGLVQARVEAHVSLPAFDASAALGSGSGSGEDYGDADEGERRARKGGEGYGAGEGEEADPELLYEADVLEAPLRPPSLSQAKTPVPTTQWKRNDSTSSAAGKLFAQVAQPVDEPSSETKSWAGDTPASAPRSLSASASSSSAAAAAKSSKSSSATASAEMTYVSSSDPPPSFEEILGGISAIKNTLASRGQPSTLLGRLLTTPSAIVPLHGDHAIGPTLKTLDELAAKLDETLRLVQVSEDAQADLVRALREAEESKAELEVANQRSSEQIEMEIELQMSREELKRLQVDNANAKVWKHALDQCQLHLKERESEAKKNERQIAELKLKLEGSGDQAILEENFKLKTQLEALGHDKDRLEKEKQRLEYCFTKANKKLEDALKESHEIQKLLHASEDELEESKAQIQRLFRTIVDMKAQTAQMEELRRRLDLLKGQVDDRDKELSSTRGVVELANALKRESALNDEHIFKLEDDLSELRINVEMAEPLRKNLQEERDKLRQATKEINELKTVRHELQFQLHDLKQVEERNAQLTFELEDYKAKVNKLPGLMGDVAKLRASSRASVHALKEQDKAIEDLKRKTKDLERLCNRQETDLRHRKDSQKDLEELQELYRPLKAENQRLREELERHKVDLSDSASRWKKLRNVVGTTGATQGQGEGTLIDVPKLNRLLRKSLKEALGDTALPTK